jgi:hypothetical protein
MVSLLELAGIFLCIFILFSYAMETPRPARSLARAAVVSASAWMAEESCILLYRSYAYHSGWYLFLDQVPLLVVVVWPVIILSAMDLTSHLRAVHPLKGIVAGAALVATDSLFIEPLSVGAGLWRWNLPGLFNVPPIGILGWFFFAVLCVALLQSKRLQDRLSCLSLLLVLPVMGTHLLLLLTWWGALRWINFPLPTPAVIGVAWSVSFFVMVTIHKKQTGRRIKKRTLLRRIPAALFFLALLIFEAADPFPLAAYALAFVIPYVELMVQQYKGLRPLP